MRTAANSGAGDPALIFTHIGPIVQTADFGSLTEPDVSPDLGKKWDESWIRQTRPDHASG
jgi:hypothetical protein